MKKHSTLNLSNTVLSLNNVSHIAIKDNVIISGKKMLRDIATVKHNIKNIDSNNIALYFNDSYIFSVTLIAMFCCHKTPVILPNIQPEFINPISKDIDHILSDVQLTTHVTTSLITEPFNEILEYTSDRLVVPTTAQLIIFTSGSSGKPKKITKKLHQLESEFVILEDLWGNKIG